MNSETKKEINSYRNSTLQFSQPVEIQFSSSLRLPLECSKSEGFWSLLSVGTYFDEDVRDDQIHLELYT